MATVTGKTSVKIDELINGSIVSGAINGSGQLILTTYGGSTINAGLVTRSVGNPWDPAVAYKNGDVVGYAGQLWRATNDSTNKPPALFNSLWNRLAGKSFDSMTERDPYFVGDNRLESWDFSSKVGNPVVSFTSNVGEFESGKQALKIAMAAGETQRFYQKEENIVRGGEIVVVTVRAKLISASSGAKLQGVLLQNDATGQPAPGAAGLGTVTATEGDQALTTSFATYTFTFPIASPTSKPRVIPSLLAVTAAAGASFCIDWVRITKKPINPGLDAYPIGAVYIAVNNTNPGTIFGGTWSVFATGRTLVGVDVVQTEFDTVEETGGFKTHQLIASEMPTHDHGAATGLDGGHTHQLNFSVGTGTATGGNLLRGMGATNATAGGAVVAVSDHSHTIAAAGGNAPHNNLQPYITVYMWKRTA